MKHIKIGMPAFTQRASDYMRQAGDFTIITAASDSAADAQLDVSFRRPLGAARCGNDVVVPLVSISDLFKTLPTFSVDSSRAFVVHGVNVNIILGLAQNRAGWFYTVPNTRALYQQSTVTNRAGVSELVRAKPAVYAVQRISDRCLEFEYYYTIVNTVNGEWELLVTENGVSKPISTGDAFSRLASLVKTEDVVATIEESVVKEMRQMTALHFTITSEGDFIYLQYGSIITDLTEDMDVPVIEAMILSGHNPYRNYLLCTLSEFNLV